MGKNIKCAGCGEIVSFENSALSRKDNETKLCNDCSQNEAMKEAEEQGLI